jgi:hypothetical protein
VPACDCFAPSQNAVALVRHAKHAKPLQHRQLFEPGKEGDICQAELVTDPVGAFVWCKRLRFEKAEFGGQPFIPEPISSDPWQSMENQPFPTLSVISDRSELSGIGISYI